MKKLAVLILVTLGGIALGCGHSNTPSPTKTSTNGNWEAQLIGGRGQAALLNFVTAFDVTNTNGGSSEPLSITGFGFFNLQSCFTTQDESGSANLTTNTENQVTGSMTYTVQSVNPGGNTLTLFTNLSNGTAVGEVTGTASNGSLTNGVVTGQWTLTGGTGCNGNGTFTLCQNAATCSQTYTKIEL